MILVLSQRIIAVQPVATRMITVQHLRQGDRLVWQGEHLLVPTPNVITNVATTVLLHQLQAMKTSNTCLKTPV